jgi:hypothetical protein
MWVTVHGMSCVPASRNGSSCSEISVCVCVCVCVWGGGVEFLSGLLNWANHRNLRIVAIRIRRAPPVLELQHAVTHAVLVTKTARPVEDADPLIYSQLRVTGIVGESCVLVQVLQQTKQVYLQQGATQTIRVLGLLQSGLTHRLVF